MKYAIGRQRPSSTDNPFVFKPGSSNGGFPSGHTTTAFAAATVFAEQYPSWEVAVPAYAAAGAVGFSRIYANQHWGSDVMAGALLGIGTAHTLRKLYGRRAGEWHLVMDLDGVKLVKAF
jgi:undecaprenyl-diphosphatase